MNWRAFGLLTSMVGVACSNAPVCAPGETQRCVCSAGEGAQSCNAEGTGWNACVCGALDGGVGDAGPSDAGTPSDVPSVDASVPACAVGATSTTIAALHDGSMGEGILVRLDGVVATSRPFLVAKTASDTCLWGLFVSAPELAVAAPGTGLFITSYGSMATIPEGSTRSYCPTPGVTPSGSAFPDDVMPGDVLTLVGTTASMLSSACSGMPGGAMVAQRQLAQTCFVEVTGTAPVPAPALMSATDLARLASPTDAAFHDLWAGARVRVTHVTASVPATPTSGCTTGSSVVGTYGTITLDDSGLVVGERPYYQGSLGTSDPCHATPVFCTTGTSFAFDHIDGFHYLDGCTWGISPADKCSDFAPASDDCTVPTCVP